MAGGDLDAVQAVVPLFELLGKKIVHQGGPGSGQQAKFCNQIVIAGTMIGVCESLLYGHKAGLELNRMLDSIRGGAAACWTLDHLAPRILQRNFDPGFFVEHFVKDMGIALEESKRMGLVLPGLTLVHQLYQTVQTLGHGRSSRLKNSDTSRSMCHRHESRRLHRTHTLALPLCLCKQSGFASGSAPTDVAGRRGSIRRYSIIRIEDEQFDQAGPSEVGTLYDANRVPSS
jgi:hypothetical protein